MTWPWAREFFRGTRISRRGGIPCVRAIALAGFREKIPEPGVLIFKSGDLQIRKLS